MSSRGSVESPLRAAIVGAGAMGRWHADAISRTDGAVVAVVDPDLARASALGVGAAYVDLHAALAAHPIDVVHVCTPLDTHAEVVGTALAVGAHVVAEKPLAPTTRSTEELLRLAADANRIVVPVHQFLFQDGFRRLVARRDRLGDLVHVELVAATAGTETTNATPGAIVDDVLPHPLALFERLLPGSATGPWDVRRPVPGELRAATTDGEATLSIVVTTRGRPTRNELVVTGTSGTAHLDLYHGFAAFEGGGHSRARKLGRPFARGAGTLAHAGENLVRRAARGETAYPGLRELIRQTYASIAEGAPPPITPEETLAVAAARDAILASPRG